MLPLLYYIFDYATTVYTDLLYSGEVIILEFLPFSLCLTYLVFCILYFRENEEKKAIERYTQLIALQSKQYKKEIENIRCSEYEMTRLRHDMRHFLVVIKTYIQHQNQQKAIQSIDELLNVMEKTRVKKYCKNDLVNTIVSYYANRMEQAQIQFETSIQMPQDLSFSDMDFASILGNGLENALHEVSEVTDKRFIKLSLYNYEGKIFLEIVNPYIGELQWKDGLPITQENDHGLGTQSIQCVTKMLNGHCQFLSEKNLFILQVII
ncbi:MAG: sensor histidine kinase [Coprobacillus cateniformis]|uniref:ATP-binding protein n=1 Tax=Longibaculum muris TaxID=1796628 RepID=UPI003AB886A2|nr:sensor histidine kinase [Coprobacillus cateniformis]